MAIDPFFGSVLGAAASLAGGLVGGGSSRQANERAATEAAHNRQAQLLTAQHGISWRAADAMNAYKSTGIHPLALLGVQGPTYSPVSTAFTTSPVGEAIGRAGQEISRGIHATADRDLRAAALGMQEVALKQAAERGGLENELLRIKIASERALLAQQTKPAMPKAVNRWLIPGQIEASASGDVGGIKEKDMERTRSAPGRPGYEPGAVPGVGMLRMPDGTLMLTKSKDAQDRLEEDTLGSVKHWLLRTFGPQFAPRAWFPSERPRPGKRWFFDWKSDLDEKDDTMRVKTGHPSWRRDW